MLGRVNNYWNIERLAVRSSSAKLFKNQELFFPNYFHGHSFSSDIAEYSECLRTKEVIFYNFELKQWKYFKNNVRKTYTGTARGRKWQMSDIFKAILIEA